MPAAGNGGSAAGTVATITFMAHRLRFFLILVVASLALSTACTSDSSEDVPPTRVPEGPSRAFAMGLSSVPTELTQESYEGAFALTAGAGDVILIQRTPPWNDLVAGEISSETASATARETDLAATHGLDLFVAIDPIDVVDGKSEIASLPPELRGAGFADERVRGAFLDYARYVAQNYRPEYLALGVEVNSYQHEHPEDFERFVVLYHEAYQEVKAISPETLVFPTFQYEELQGLLPTDAPRPPQWYLLNRFAGRMDLLAVSSFPALAFENLSLIPDSYYAQLRAFSDAPIALTSLGYPSDLADPSTGLSGEEAQADFLGSTLEVAQQLAMPLLVWFLGQDPSFAGSQAQSFLTLTGLKAQDDSIKAAWLIWENAAGRPMDQSLPTGTPEEAG
jgi:hypothetical protein